MEKPIFNFESYGVIDEKGNVRNHSRKTYRKTCLDHLGQRGLTISGKRVLIKNLVAQTFLRDFDPATEHVIFIDGDSNNFHYINLDIIPIDRFKLSQKVAEQIKQEYSAGYKQKDLASKYKVCHTMISKIVNGKRYKS
ncbi:hypothetical protein ABDC18_002862 [Escherichia coli]